MKITQLTGWFLLALSSQLIAEDDIKLEGIDTKPYQDLFQVPEDQALQQPPAAPNALSAQVTTDSTQGDRCMEMSRQIEALKGKPLQRSALNDRYQQECGLK
jgi:hypothetical protein